MELTGKIIAVLPAAQGVSQRTGNPWMSQEYVIDILLDSSGSQAKRQPQVAAQGYIISEALSRVGIPHKVMSFCSFWD